MLQIDRTFTVEIHFDHGCQVFTPGNLVGMMFVGSDKHHRLMTPQIFGKAGVGLRAQHVLQHGGEVSSCRRRQGHANNLLQLVDRAGGAAADRNDPAIGACVDRLFDRTFRLLQQMGHGTAADVILGMGIGIDTLEVLQVLLNQVQAAAGCRVVGINHQAFPEWCCHRCIRTDNLASEEIKVHSAIRFHRLNDERWET